MWRKGFQINEHDWTAEVNSHEQIDLWPFDLKVTKVHHNNLKQAQEDFSYTDLTILVANCQKNYTKSDDHIYIAIGMIWAMWMCMVWCM